MTKRLVIPAVRDNRVDHANPIITSESDRIDSRATSHQTCTRLEALERR